MCEYDLDTGHHQSQCHAS